MKKIISVVLVFQWISITAQNNLYIVPMPAEVKMGPANKYFILSPATIIYIDDSKPSQNYLSWYLQKSIRDKYGFDLSIKSIKQQILKDNFIELNLAQEKNSPVNAYSFTVTGKGITITGEKDENLFYGLQTLFQILPVAGKKPGTSNTISIPLLSIKDYPRFSYRGMHLDVGRHFFPVSFIKKYIDYLAAYKYNTFHWHLTDDQGWRIEIKKYPLLTQVGGYRNGTITGRYPGKTNDGKPYGGFYTQEDIKEIVQYAADRYINVIPEIEMPGHASAAIAAYPQLSCFPEEDTKILPSTPWAGSRKGKQVQQTWGVFEDVFAPSEFTFNFLQDVLDEVMQLFPSKYIHIGGDECPKESWKRSAFCQQLIKENNLKDEHGLQSYFINRIEKYINTKGKKIIGWDEILEGGLAPNATVMSWRGEEGGIEAAKQKHDVIMTPGSHCYIDHSQSKNEDSVTIGGYLPLEKVYGYEPIPAALNDEQAKHILGAQGNVWTEYMQYPSKVEYMIFPRMIALSEVLWSPKEKRNWKYFEKRLPALLERLNRQKINFSKAYYDLKATVIPDEIDGGVLWKLESKNPNDKILYTVGIEDSRINTYTKPVKPVISGFTLNAFIKSKNNLSETLSTVSQTFYFNKATGKKITLQTEPSKSYPGDGAFTLVNGVQNEKGLAKSNEFLGFLGKDLDALIDLKTEMDISKVTLHVLDQNGSWIYLPKQVEIYYIPNIDFLEPEMKDFPKVIRDIDPVKDKGIKTIIIDSKQKCRYIKVVAKNFGIIPSGDPGAGNPAWLFVDEIEVE